MLSITHVISTRHSVFNISDERIRHLPDMTGRDVKSQIRETQRSWLRKVLKKTDESPSELAVNAGMANVTLTRFLNRADYKGVLSPLNIEKIKQYAKVSGPDERGPTAQTDFGEGLPIDQHDSSKTFRARMIAAAIEGRKEAKAWILTTSAIESLGYRSGDILIVDPETRAYAGTAVCAEVIDLKTKNKETIFRIIEPPYLVGSSGDPATRRPILIDNERVRVVGAVTAMLRVLSD